LRDPIVKTEIPSEPNPLTKSIPNEPKRALRGVKLNEEVTTLLLSERRNLYRADAQSLASCWATPVDRGL